MFPLACVPSLLGPPIIGLADFVVAGKLVDTTLVVVELV